MIIHTNPKTISRFLGFLFLILSLCCFYSCNNLRNNKSEDEQRKIRGVERTFEFLKKIENNNRDDAKGYLSAKGKEVFPIDNYIDIISEMISKHGFPLRKDEYVDTSIHGPDLHVTVYFDEPKKDWVRPDVHVRYKDFERDFKIDYLAPTTGGKVPDLTD